METNEDINTSIATSKFPFIMILTATLFRGVLFSILNGPLMWNLLCGNRYNSMSELYNSGIIAVLKDILVLGGGVVSASILLILCMSVGLLLSPVDNLVATSFALLLNPLIKRILPVYYPIFSQREFANLEYAPFLSWLMTNPTKKAHWEWELFLYQLSWSIFTIIGAWALLSILLINSSLTLRVIIPYVIITLFFLTYGLSRGIVMSRVHMYYFEQYSMSKT